MGFLFAVKGSCQVKHRTVFIYALTDPAGNIRYVGQSVHPEIRYEQHLKECANTPKTAWISELLRAGAKPDMIILQKTDKPNADYVEKWWIALGASRGWQLVNVGNPTWKNPNFAELFTSQLRSEFDQFRIEHDPVIFVTRQHIRMASLWLRVLLSSAIAAFIGWSAYGLELASGNTEAAAIRYGVIVFLVFSHLGVYISAAEIARILQQKESTVRSWIRRSNGTTKVAAQGA